MADEENSVAALKIPEGTPLIYFYPDSFDWIMGTFVRKDDINTTLSIKHYFGGKYNASEVSYLNENVYYMYTTGTKVLYQEESYSIKKDPEPKLGLIDRFNERAHTITIEKLVSEVRKHKKSKWDYENDQKFVYQYFGSDYNSSSDYNKYYAEQSARRCLDYNNIQSYELTFYTKGDPTPKREIIMKEVLETYDDTKHIPIYKIGTKVRYARKKKTGEPPYTVTGYSVNKDATKPQESLSYEIQRGETIHPEFYNELELYPEDEDETLSHEISDVDPPQPSSTNLVKNKRPPQQPTPEHTPSANTPSTNEEPVGREGPLDYSTPLPNSELLLKQSRTPFVDQVKNFESPSSQGSRPSIADLSPIKANKNEGKAETQVQHSLDAKKFGKGWRGFWRSRITANPNNNNYFYIPSIIDLIKNDSPEALTKRNRYKFFSDDQMKWEHPEFINPLVDPPTEKEKKEYGLQLPTIPQHLLQSRAFEMVMDSDIAAILGVDYRQWHEETDTGQPENEWLTWWINTRKSCDVCGVTYSHNK